MTNFIKIDKSFLLVMIPVIRMSLPWLSNRTHALIPFLMTMGFVAFKWLRNRNRRQLYENRSFSAVMVLLLFSSLALAFINNLYAVFGHGSFSVYAHFATIAGQLIMVLVCYYSILDRKFAELKFLSAVSLVCLTITGVLTSRGFGAGYESGGTRMMMLTSAVQDNLEYQATAMDVAGQGFGTYDFVYASALLTGPVMMAVWKIKKWTCIKILCAGSFVGLIIIVLTSGLATPVGVMLLCLTLTMSGIVFKRKSLVITLGVLACLMFFLYAVAPAVYSPLGGLLKMIGENMFEGSLKDHVMSVADAIGGDKGSYAAGRAALQMVSWDVFCEHPIWGRGYFRSGDLRGDKTIIGGHSFVLDTLANGGLIGGTLLILYYVSCFKFWKVMARKYFGRDCEIMSSAYMFSMIFWSIANPSSVVIPGDSFILLPSLCMFIIDSQQKMRRR